MTGTGAGARLRLRVPAWDWEGIADTLHSLPCRLLGHSWREVPYALRRSLHNPDPERMRFRCRRCGVVAGFTN